MHGLSSNPKKAIDILDVCGKNDRSTHGILLTLTTYEQIYPLSRSKTKQDLCCLTVLHKSCLAALDFVTT